MKGVLGRGWGDVFTSVYVLRFSSLRTEKQHSLLRFSPVRAVINEQEAATRPSTPPPKRHTNQRQRAINLKDVPEIKMHSTLNITIETQRHI